MKTGVIVYVSGEPPQKSSVDMETEVRDLSIDADMVSVVSKTIGHFTVHDAWRSLLVKGMHRIFCVIAESTASGKLHLSDRMMRLYG